MGQSREDRQQASPRLASVTAEALPCLPDRGCRSGSEARRKAHRALEVQFAGFGLGDHAVEVTARRGPAPASDERATGREVLMTLRTLSKGEIKALNRYNKRVIVAYC